MPMFLVKTTKQVLVEAPFELDAVVFAGLCPELGKEVSVTAEALTAPVQGLEVHNFDLDGGPR